MGCVISTTFILKVVEVRDNNAVLGVSPAGKGVLGRHVGCVVSVVEARDNAVLGVSPSGKGYLAGMWGALSLQLYVY